MGVEDIFRNRVIMSRLANGWSQTELGERSGLHKEQISRIERGIHPNPRIDTVSKIARAFGVQPGYLLDDEDEACIMNVHDEEGNEDGA